MIYFTEEKNVTMNCLSSTCYFFLFDLFKGWDNTMRELYAVWIRMDSKVSGAGPTNAG